MENKVFGLIGDIGGTHSRLSLVKIPKNKSEAVEYVITEKLHSQDFSCIDDLLEKYLEPFKNTESYPVLFVIGVPGPIFNNEATVFANLNWPAVKGIDIAKKFGIKAAYFLNDFVVNGYGILSDLEEGNDYIKLNNVEPDLNGPIGMIGAGTGLGHGLIFKNEDSKYHEVFPSEGGHQDFAPSNDIQMKYFKFLQTHYDIEHVSVERACSGPVLPAMYHFFTDYDGIADDCHLIDKNNLHNKEIIENGLSKKCRICTKVLDLFVDIYGAAAGNIALLTLPTRGIYLLGGLSIALEKVIREDDRFLNKFLDKGRLKNILKKIPLFLIKNDLIGVKGAEVKNINFRNMQSEN